MGDNPAEEPAPTETDETADLGSEGSQQSGAGVIEEEITKIPSVDSVPALNVYQIKPPLDEKFKESPVKEVIRAVLTETLAGKVYNKLDAKTWTIDIANIINEKVKELNMKRYKHVVQVVIGEMKGAGVKAGVRCLWDSETDGYTSDLFVNDTIFSVVVVFAVYLY